MDTNRCRVRTPIGRSPLRRTAYYIFRATRARERESPLFTAYSVNFPRFPAPFLSRYSLSRRCVISERLFSGHRDIRVRVSWKKIYIISHETEIYRSAVNVRSVSRSIHCRYGASYMIDIFEIAYRYDAPRLFHVPRHTPFFSLPPPPPLPLGPPSFSLFR